MAEDLGQETVAEAQDTDRGHYKIFLGMAAGVGKTYRMLQEGHAERTRAGTWSSAIWSRTSERTRSSRPAGLEVIPRRRVEYRDTVLEEMDLPAVLARDPDLALIDELAHTNPPGIEHEKRYEDIADVLSAGIDVFSTVNVQHLESLNDQVAELTGVHVRETVPDSILGTADEVVLIDLTPEDLIARLRAGKVYPDQNIEAALNNFFRIENLAALAKCRCARWPRASSQSASSSRHAPPRLGRSASRWTLRRPSASESWLSSARGEARSGWCGGHGGRPSVWGRT